MPETIQIYLNEANAANRKVFFEMRDASGNPVTTASGLQPAISVAGGGWSTTNISTLTPIAPSTNGLYSATLTQAAVSGALINKVIKTIVNQGSVYTEGSTVQILRPSWDTARKAYLSEYHVGGSGQFIGRKFFAYDSPRW